MARTKRSASAIPAGYQQVQSGGRAPFHDFKTSPILEGKIVGMHSFTDRWKNKKQIMEIASKETGEVTAVSESAALTGLFKQAKKGAMVWIRFDGLVKIKGRKQPMRQYTTGIGK